MIVALFIIKAMNNSTFMMIHLGMLKLLTIHLKKVKALLNLIEL